MRKSFVYMKLHENQYLLNLLIHRIIFFHNIFEVILIRCIRQYNEFFRMILFIAYDKISPGCIEYMRLINKTLLNKA